MASSALLDHIKTKILMRGGPLSIAEYMQDCLTSPQGGFYMHRDVFGSSGDFVTSPEISQLFGEMVGIWAVHTWMTLGRPPRLQLVEMGPGRGTLMADLLRGTAAFRDFSSSLEVHLVEVSPALRKMQWRALRCSAAPSNSKESSSSSSRKVADAEELRYLRAGMTPIVGQAAAAAGGGGGGARTAAAAPSAAGDGGGGAGDGLYSTPERGVCGFSGCSVSWHAALDAVPDGPGPALYIAHEFFDALPVHQFVRDSKRGWLEKMVDVRTDDGDEHRNPDNPDQGLGSPGGRPDSNPDLDRSERRISSPGSGDATRAAATAGRACGGGGGGGQPPSSTAGSGLRLVLSPGPTPAAALLVPRRLAGLSREEADAIDALEVSAVGMATAERLAQRIGRHGGAALLVDYGREGPPYGDSLMAIRGHQGVGILDAPGSADLSAWVDFGALRLAAEGAAAAAAAQPAAAQPLSTVAAAAGVPPSPPPPRPVRTSGPVTQAAFLRALGIETRLNWLAGRAEDPAAATALAAGCARLLGGSKEGGMGLSYKVMAVHQEDLREMAGF